MKCRGCANGMALAVRHASRVVPGARQIADHREMSDADLMMYLVDAYADLQTRFDRYVEITTPPILMKGAYEAEEAWQDILTAAEMKEGGKR